MRSDTIRTTRSRRWVLAAGLASVAAPALADTHLTHHDIARMVGDMGAGAGQSLRILLPHGSGANVVPIAAEFLRLTGVEILITEVPVDDVDVQLTIDRLSGTQTFDLALPPTFAVPDLVTGGLLAPLSDMAGFDAIHAAQDGSLFTTGDTFDGATYGFQTDGDAYLMFYNMDIATPDERSRYADHHGVAFDVPRTWHDLDQQMRWFHRPDAGQFGGLLFRNSAYVAWEWWIRFHAQGMWPLSRDMVPQLATDAGVTALEDMIRAGECLAPDAASIGLFGNWERYRVGDIYANVGWGGSQKFFNQPDSALRGKLAYGKTPGGMVGDQVLSTPYFNWGWNYVVLDGSDKTDLALLFAAFATSPDMSTLAVRQTDGFFDPYRAEHYADSGIVDAYSQDFLDVHQDSMQTAIPDFYLARQGDYFLALSKWINRALAGQTTPDVALARIEQQWNIITAQVGRAKQIERWQALRLKYPAQARRLLVDR